MALIGGDSPVDTMSELEQRLEKFKESEEQAREQNNASKARRLGRIIKVNSSHCL